MYADDGGIVCIFQNGVPLIPESRAIAVQREQEVAEHAATGLSIQTSENSIRLFKSCCCWWHQTIPAAHFWSSHLVECTVQSNLKNHWWILWADNMVDIIQHRVNTVPSTLTALSIKHDWRRHRALPSSYQSAASCWLWIRAAHPVQFLDPGCQGLTMFLWTSLILFSCDRALAWRRLGRETPCGVVLALMPPLFPLFLGWSQHFQCCSASQS